MTAAPMTLEVLASDQHFDRQLALVREHWTSVRCLWLDSAGAVRLGPDLTSDFLLGCGMPGIAHIKPARDGRFAFAETSVTEISATAVIIPCYDTIPGILDANPERHVDHLVDLVAVDLDRPERFWRRRGEALVLGAAYLDIAGQEGEPITVFKTPISWLQGAGTGVVVLDWDWARDLLLDHELIAEDLGLGERLEAALKPSISIGRAAA